MNERPPFRWYRDPICIGCMILYIANRWLLKPQLNALFLHDHLNDLICLPLFLPIIVNLQCVARIRRHDGPPTIGEVIHNGLIFTLVFELILPRLSMFISVADPWDSFHYLLGGSIAYLYWNRRATRISSRRSIVQPRQRALSRARVGRGVSTLAA